MAESGLLRPLSWSRNGCSTSHSFPASIGKHDSVFRSPQDNRHLLYHCPHQCVDQLWGKTRCSICNLPPRHRHRSWPLVGMLCKLISDCCSQGQGWAVFGAVGHLNHMRNSGQSGLVSSLDRPNPLGGLLHPHQCPCHSMHGCSGSKNSQPRSFPSADRA